MTTDQETILGFLLDHIATLSYMLDSTVHVAKELPDWPSKIQQALNDPSRLERTNAKLEQIHKLFDGFRQGVLNDEDWLTLVSEVQALNNEDWFTVASEVREIRKT